MCRKFNANCLSGNPVLGALFFQRLRDVRDERASDGVWCCLSKNQSPVSFQLFLPVSLMFLRHGAISLYLSKYPS